MFAQTTITNSDVQTAYAVGSQCSFYSDTSGTSVFVGSASGTAQTWDLRALPFSYQGRGVSIAPAGAPHAAKFPTANIVMYSVTEVSADSITGYTYNQLTSSMFWFLGAAGTDTAVTRYSPVIPAEKLPCTYNTTWSYLSDTNHIIPGIMWVVTSTTYTVDGFGTLRLPEGDFPALRQKSVTFSYSYNIINGLSRKKSIVYRFVTRGISEAAVSIDSTQENLSTVVPEYVVRTGKGTTDVKGLVSTRIPIDFALRQNYPNPFNPSTSIEFAIPHPARVRLGIYTVLGQEVAVLVDEDLSAGTYKSSWTGSSHASGVYVCRLQAGGVSRSIKLYLLK